jgi:hypothetical protein
MQMPTGLTDGIFISQMSQIVSLLKTYYAHKSTLPSTPQGEDELLAYLYKNMFGGEARTQDFSQSGTFRVLGNLRMAVDTTIQNIPAEIWRKNPPDNWQAPSNSITIYVDGDSRYMIWTAAISGTPLVDSNNKAIIFDGDLKSKDAM